MSRSLYYILDAHHQPVPCDGRTWALWFETAERHVARDVDEGGAVRVVVSTVFLGLDHNYDRQGPPILWETFIFGGPLAGEGGRYASLEAALEGHQAWCVRVRAAG